MRKLVLLYILLLTIGSTAFSQMTISSWRAFENNPELMKTQLDDYQNYIRVNYPDSIPGEEFGEYKAFLRFMYYWHGRVDYDEQGELSYKPYHNAVKQYLLNPVCISDPLANWEVLEKVQNYSQEEGLITEILYDPQNPDDLLASSNHGGLWKYNSTLDYWYNVTDTDNMRIPGIAATEIVRDPFDHNKLYASTGSGIHGIDYGAGVIESSDNGNTWIAQSFQENFSPMVVKIAIDPTDTNPSDGTNMYAIGLDAVYYTTNSGVSWLEMTQQPELNDFTKLYDLVIDDSGNLFITTRGQYGYYAQCFKYSGNNWVEILTSDITINPQRTKFTIPHNDLIYAISDIELSPNNTIRRLYKSTDNGDTWHIEKNSVSSVDGKCEIEYSPESGLVYIGKLSLYVYNPSNSELYKINYVYNIYHEDIRDIKITDFSNGYETVLFANDGGVSEIKINVNDFDDHDIVNISGRFLTANNLIGIGVGNGMDVFAMAGGVHGNSLKAISNLAYPGGDRDGGDCLVHPEDENIYYHMSNGKIKRSGDIIYQGTSNDWFIGMRYHMAPNNYDKIFFGQQRAIGLYNDETETVLIKPTPHNTQTGEMLKQVGAIEKSNNGILYISDYVRNWNNDAYRLVKSTDDGDSWTDMTQSTVHNSNGSTNSLGQKLYGRTINTIESNPDNPNELWIGIGGIVLNTNGLVENTFRVLHSQDGGQNWYEYSQGLTAFPVNYIYYHYPTEMLFAATDAGVFYRDPSDNNMTEWACFSNKLPMGIVTDLDASDCGNMLYASIDGRGMYKTPIPFSIVNTNVNVVFEDDYLVGDDETWNDIRYFDGDIAIAPGASLRINGEIRFTENGSITVMPGGELFVAGRLDVVNTCDYGFWKGIQVRGNANMPQTPQYQGSVRTLLGAEICNAEIGIAAYGIDHNNNGNYIQDSQGGITIIDKALFINNKTGIDIRDYRYDNGGTSTHSPVIINSEFKTYATFYKDPMETPVHIQILNNNNVVVSGCDFYGEGDLLPFLRDMDLKPTGIKTWNSPTYIRDCEFHFLGYGVYGMDIMAAANILDIDNNFFDDCSKSVYINGHSNTRITRNNMKYSSIKQADKTYLAYMDQCSNFAMEENTFHLATSSENVSTNFCVIVNNCGPSNNSIYKNDFNSGYYGILAQNQNRDHITHSGLTLKCNFFHQAVRNNIMVTATELSDNNGIAPSQGSMGSNPGAPAGNLFSEVWVHPVNGQTTTDAHFWNLPNLNATVTYFHHNPANPNIPIYVEPGYTLNGNDYSYLNNGIFKQTNYDADWNEYSCPSHLEGNGDDKKSRMSSTGNLIDSTTTTLTALTDGGNTQELNTEVNNAQSGEGFVLRNELLNTSPYLSDTVLQTASQKEEVLTNPLIRDILVANPQSAKNVEVLQSIEERSNPMPDYMKQQILNGQTLAGQKEQLEASLQDHRGNYANALNHLLAHYANDSTINPLDSILPLLTSSKEHHAYYQLAGIYLQQNNTGQMNNTLNSLPANFSLSNSQAAELQNISAYYQMLATAKNDNRGINQLNETEINQLWDFRNDSADMASAWARNILVYLNELDYTPPIILPETDNKSTLIEKPFEIEVPNDEFGSIKLYPNPAKDYIVCDYNIKIPYNTAQLLITEASSGKNIRTRFLELAKNAETIDLGGLIPGSYIASLRTDDTIIYSVTFNIIH